MEVICNMKHNGIFGENFSSKGNELHLLEPFIFNNVNDGTPWKVAPLGFPLKRPVFLTNAPVSAPRDKDVNSTLDGK